MSHAAPMNGAGLGAIAAEPAEQPGVQRPDGLLLCLLLGIALIAAMMVAFVVGPLGIDAHTVVQVIASRLGLADATGLSQQDIAVVWELRMPRALLAAMVGAALAVAGATLQSLFGNPLADPGVIGVSGGAATGAVAAIVLGLTTFGTWTIPVAAFAGGMATTLLIYTLARPGASGTTTTLLLVGIAIGAGTAAINGLFTYIADADELQTLVFWQMGSVARAGWADVGAVLPLFVLGIGLLLWSARSLDLLALGERNAKHLGLDVERTRLLLVCASALLVGAAVAFAGGIGFVGLVVPHIMRMLAGPAHRWLLPLAALGGATLLVVADTLARTLDPPAEIPIGLFTAAVGAPFFLFLVLRESGRGAPR